MFDIRLQHTKGRFVLDVKMRMQAGKFHVLLGPSGAGKSTLLRLIAGLESDVNGRIEVPKGKPWLAPEGGVLPSRSRSVGLMFQHHALFPHLTVEQNVAFGLSGGDIYDRVRKLLMAVGLEERNKARPSQLSGGECQRVALARALAPQPELLLLDEPFSSLDDKTSREVQQLIRDLQRCENFTVLMVTHNRSEAYRLADHVWLLKEGRIIDGGEPDQMLLGKRISGRFQMQAEVCALDTDGLMDKVELMAEGRRFFVLIDETSVCEQSIEVGSRVVLTAKATDFSLQTIE